MSRLSPILTLTVLLGGCATQAPSISMWLEQPAERALLAGVRAYDDAAYPTAEVQLQRALGTGLKHPHDQALAHKLLAFIQCSTERVAACEQSFAAARKAHPALTLNKAEIGNPLWGPVYKRIITTP